MEFNVGGLKWAAITFLLCLLLLSFAPLGRLAFWLVTFVATVASYQIGSFLLLKSLRSQRNQETDTGNPET